MSETATIKPATQTAYKQCTRCVLDTTSKTISFDEQGVCNYCHEAEKQLNKFIRIDPAIRKKNLDEIVAKIKKAGKGKKYDCILGLSGGVDSTYTALLAKELGLRPMAVHFDNGWNSELAVKNIENIISKLNLDLHTYVIDWEEFKDIQLAYIKASVVDIEMPTDQLIFAALNKLAHKHGIKCILSGYNIVTEFGMPHDWVWRQKQDQTNLLNIYAKFGSGKKLATMPRFDFYKRFFYQQICGIGTESLLNYVDYNKKAVKERISQELGWKDYGGKHYESVFTRFYQGYILPKKFNIDKRKAHLSALIWSGQITRQEALGELQGEPYDVKLQEEDKEFVIKKFGLTRQEFEAIMAMPRREHAEYGLESANASAHNFYAKLLSPVVYFLSLYRRVINKLK